MLTNPRLPTPGTFSTSRIQKAYRSGQAPPRSPPRGGGYPPPAATLACARVRARESVGVLDDGSGAP